MEAVNDRHEEVGVGGQFCRSALCDRPVSPNSSRSSDDGNAAPRVETFPAYRLGVVGRIAPLRFNVLSRKPLVELVQIVFTSAHPPPDRACVNVGVGGPRGDHSSNILRQALCLQSTIFGRTGSFSADSRDCGGTRPTCGHMLPEGRGRVMGLNGHSRAYMLTTGIGETCRSRSATTKIHMAVDGEALLIRL
ncbi:hypothetical protein FHW92_005136 [Novosphingobium sp. SG707]|nr:hypothetical protein [Novosphingobium sp. SG707]